MSPVPPIPPFVWPGSPVPNVQPFTHKDGLSYLQRLERIVKYLNTEIVPYIDKYVGELAETFTTEVNKLIEQVNEAISLVEGEVNDAQEAATAAAASAALAAQYASEAAGVQDSAITAIFNNISSELRQAMDDVYASKATQTVVDSGRLSAATLDARFAEKVDQDDYDTHVADYNAFKITTDASIEDLDGRIDDITPTEIGAVTSRVHVILAMGQSNMQGHGTPTSATLDPTNSRIYQYGAHSLALTVATEPLDMPDNNITGNGPTGIGPALQFARHMLADLPKEDVVIVVPTAVGSSALLGTGVNDWQWGGNATNLSTQAVSLAQGAINAAHTMFPKADVVMAAYLWHQGERDGTNNVTMTNYLNALGNLITGFRSTLGFAPFIVGQMVPEAMGDGTRRAINEAHSRAPYNFDSVGFATGPAGQTSDNIHYNGPGQRQLARDYYRVFKRVVGKLAPDTPIMPVAGAVPVVKPDWIIQYGSEPHVASGTDGQNVTIQFPVPFGGVPHVMAQTHLNSTGIFVTGYAAGATATQFTLRSRASAAGGTGQAISWIAYGPRYEGN